MRIERINTKNIALGTLLGAVLGACLPSMPAGERGVQCWTDRAADLSQCNLNFIGCIDAADPDDVEDFVSCNDAAERCIADTNYQAEQCDSRAGCVAQQRTCQDDCDLVAEDLRFSCQDRCVVEFERCAPWYERTCEIDCGRTAAICRVDAFAAYQAVRCEDERLECVLDCY